MKLSSSQRNLIFLSSLGCILELYDFIIYALFASVIAQAFFPTSNPMTSLIAAFATYAIGYVIRPVGGIIFGHFGDKIGRKKSFTLSVLLMALGTFFIALVPTYKSIGLAAPIILTLLRVVQGLSIGGEIPGAIAYVTESIPQRKGLVCGIIFSCLILGIILGSLIHALLVSILSPASLQAWGWRVPFIIGGLFGFMSYSMRLRLRESALYEAITERIAAFPIMSVFKYRFKNFIAAILIVSLIASPVAVLFIFIPVYVGTILHYHAKDFMWIKLLALLVAALLCLFTGYIADKINLKKFIITSCFLSFLLSYPIFYIYVNAFSFYWIALLLSAVIFALTHGALPSVLAELFPIAYRYSGLAISYNIGFAIFAGLTPFIAVLLVHHTGLTISPVIILLSTSILALIGIFMAKRRSLV